MNVIDDTIDFENYLKMTEAKTLVRPAKSFAATVKKSLRSYQDSSKIYLPWSNTVENFNFRDGEMTIWAGQNGHGKSTIVNHVTLSLLGQEQKVCIASPEMKPHNVIKHMLRMYSGMNPSAPEYRDSNEALKQFDALLDEMLDWTNKRLWLYDQVGMVSPEAILGMVRYAANELKVKHVFIDNLSKIVRGEDDYNAQKDFVSDLFAAARDTGVHVHLVHHIKKLSKESDVPDKTNVKGTGAITDIVDNLFMVWRNKPKEDDIKMNGSLAKMTNDPDVLLLCRKQREYEGNDEGEPTIRLWYDRESQQYLPFKGAKLQTFYRKYPHRDD